MLHMIHIKYKKKRISHIANQQVGTFLPKTKSGIIFLLIKEGTERRSTLLITISNFLKILDRS